MPSFGPYEIRGELGRGAMAVVYRCWDPSLEREVAVKVPTLDSSMPPELIAEFNSRFIKEGHAAARLNHPNIITVHTADVFDGTPAIVMELLDGSTLSKLIDHNGLFPALIQSIFFQLLDAMTYAHARGVVHRDIKPDNIFVTSANYVKLTDFGVAALSTSGPDAVIAGSPGYMSPEQARGEVVDARADLFSFAVVAYEMLVGFNPFGATEGSTRDEIILRTFASESLPAFESIPNISAVLARGLRQNPRERWSSSEQFKQELARAIELDGAAFANHRKGKHFEVAHDQGPAPTATINLASVSVPKPDRSTTGFLVAGGVVYAIALLVALASGSIAFVVILLLLGLAGLALWMVYGKKKEAEKAGLRLAGPGQAPLLGAQDAGAFGSGTGRTISVLVNDASGSHQTQASVPLTIGRDGLLGGIPLSDGRISRQHVCVESGVTGLTVRDLGSRNGTLLNGHQLQGAVAFNIGDQLLLGDTTIQLLGVTDV